MKKYTLHILFLFLVTVTYAQTTQSVLFIGNSYTGTNNLPQIVKQVALSAGDTLVFDKHTPGGTRFSDHAASSAATQKINAQNWDYVVLQGQSQEPSFPIEQVETEVFPYAQLLCDKIRANYACSIPLFYMTWGRKYGDSQNCPNWPPVCTYEGMDSLLSLRYQMMATANNADLSPVGAVWKYLRNNNPDVELYSADNSHPSLAGSYAAACTFYTMIFKADPTQISDDYSLPAEQANAIQQAAKVVVFDALNNWETDYTHPLPVANFTYTAIDESIEFVNESSNADEYFWDFGDGSTSTEENPIHDFMMEGEFQVTLTATSCAGTNVVQQIVDNLNISTTQEVQQNLQVSMYPNPTNNELCIASDTPILTVVLTNLAGQQVLHWTGKSNRAKMDIHTLPKGVYWVKIELEGQAQYYVKRIVKE